MGMVRVSAFTVSLDGFGAGPGQALERPMGQGAETLHRWMLPTRTFHALTGQPGGETGVDDDFAARSMEGVGAWIMGRNMFGPVRGAWADETWKGWWGETPPYRVPVFVLTHHARAPVEMRGGTVFHFVTDGIGAALERAREAAEARDVRIGGGAATVRQYLREGVVDEMHLVVSPVLLGRGEALLEGIDLPGLGFGVAEHVPGARATHVVLRREAA